MYDYDKFTVSNTALTTTAAVLGYNGAGTLTVAANYRMRLRNLMITNAGTTSTVATVSKIGSGGTITIANPSIAAGSTWPSNPDEGEYVIESGYYLTAVLSVGTGSIIATGEFVPE